MARPADRTRMPLVARAVALLVVLALVGCATTPPLPPRAVELNRDGAAALAAGDLTAAEARLAVALEWSPRFTEAWVNLGYVELRRGNLDRAHQHFRKARGLNRDLPAPHHALGLLADERGRAPEAEAHYRRALEVDPGFVASRANLARRLFARGAFEEARDQYLKLSEVVPDAPEGLVGLVECLLRLERESDAEVALGRARARFGDTPELLLLVARILLRRDAFAEAEDVLGGLTHDADRTRAAAAWAWTGVARLGRGDVRGAREASREALLADAANAVARTVLAGAEAR